MLRRGSKLTTEQFRVAYPSWGDLLTLLGVFIVATVLGSLLTGVLQKIGSVSVGFGAFLGYVIQFSLVIIFGLFQRKIRSPKETRLLKFGLAKLDFVIILWGTIMVLATGVVIEPLLNLFPETYLDRLGNIMAAGGWMMFTSIVIAPIMEEILFRGILQDALMRKYGVFVGILIASAVFGIVHLIPQQVVNAFMIGIVLGYIYYRTGALLPVILIHCINNAISYFTWMLNGETLLSTREQMGNDTLYFTVYGIACVLFVIGFVSIAIRISKEEKRRQLEVSGGDGAQTVANASSPDSGLMTEEPLVASSVSNEKTGLNGQKTSTDHTNRVD
jgi:membrane protease YdiL (CAAX protease family)